MSIEGKSSVISDKYIFSIDNLLSAWWYCRRGKSKKKDVMEFEYYLA